MGLRLEDHLSVEEARQLRVMAEQRQEWTFLVRLLASVEAAALRQAVEFSDAQEAFERKGYAKGITTCRDLIQQLYAAKTTGVTDGSTTSTPARPKQDEFDAAARS